MSLKYHEKIRFLFDSASFQKEYQTLLEFLSEICEIPSARFSFIDNDTLSTIGIDQEEIPSNIALLNLEVIKERKIKIESSTFLYIGIPIIIEKENSIGIVFLTNNTTHVLNELQIKTIEFVKGQIECLIQLNLQNLELQQKETQLQVYIDNSKEIIFEMELDGTICFISKSWVNLIGFNGKEVLNKKYETFVHPEDKQKCTRFLTKVLTYAVSEGIITYRILHKEGHYLWCTSNIKYIETETRSYFVGNCRDITEYMEVRLELTNQKKFYEKILDCLPTDVAVFDSNHKYLYLNPAAIRNDELRKYIIGKDDFEYAKHTGRDQLFAQERRDRFSKAAKTNSIVEWIDEIKKNDGTTSFHTRKFAPVYDNNENLEMMVGFGVDITAQKKAEAALKISHERFSYASQATSDGLWDWNILTDEVFVGESYSTLFGHYFENNTINASECENLVHPDDRDTYIQKYKVILDKDCLKWSEEYRYLKSDESYAYVIDKAIIIRDEDGNAVRMIGAMQDITERKNVEEQNRLLIEENNRNKNIQLNEAKNMYRLLADNTVDLVSLHSLDTTYEYLSPSIVNLMGFTPEELIGKSPLEYIHPNDLEQVINSYTHFITEEDYVNPYVQARFRNKKGEYIWFEVKATIVKENGNPVRFQTSARNITQQKEVQYAMEKALAQERELNELRTNLVSTISHEFRTPMTTIRASAELIEMYIEGHNFVNSPQLQKRINTIIEEIDRIVELMNAVLTISKDDAGKTNFNPKVIDLKQICLDVIETSYTYKMGGRKVQTVFEGEEFTVFADKNLMEYSLFNLFNNAFKYSVGKDDIILNLRSTAAKIEVQITDFGIGIPEKDIPKLFNTFFRASNTDGIQGTGLGLYIVKTFTERNFGTISVQSVLGKGTTVILQFPVYNL
jgi:PAS domain S-box-containing protein